MSEPSKNRVYKNKHIDNTKKNVLLNFVFTNKTNSKSILFSINLTTVLRNKSLHVELSFTSLVVHISDFAKDFTFFPAHIMYSAN